MKSPWFNEEHELFRQSVRQFIDTEVRPHTEKWEEEEFIPREVFRRMGELGFLGVNFPEKYGGSDVDFFYSVIFLEEVARAGMAGLSAAQGVHQFMSTAHLAKVGSEELKQKYLVPAITGEKIGGLAVTEPGAGSDVANIKTRAVREGDYYIINGSKTFITNGVYGDYVTVSCKTDPDAGTAGISLIIIDRDTPGFTANKLKKIGWRSSDTGELFFENVKVPASNLIGEENQGFYYIMESFQLERLVAACGAIGGAEHALEITLKYIHEREAFGRPIKKFQSLRHDIADIATDLEAIKQLTYHTAWLHENGEFAVKECSMAKLMTSEVGKKIADVCLQCFGGYGYMEEYPIARMYRDARVGTIVGGTSQIMREIIAKMVIDEVHYDSAYEQPKPAQQKETTEKIEKKPVLTETIHENGNSTQNQNTSTTMSKPETAAEIIRSLTERFRPEKAEGFSALFHFDIEGDRGGQFTITVDSAGCKVEDGHLGEPSCIVKSTDSTYEDVELGRTNPQMAVMMGKIKISNLGEMMRFSGLFTRLTEN